jgi:hypothetical protein
MSHLGLDERSETESRTGFWRRLGPSPANGHGQRNGRSLSDETIRYVLGLVLGAIVAYFTTIATMQTEVAVLNEREQNHYNELKQLLQEIKADVKDLGRK